MPVTYDEVRETILNADPQISGVQLAPLSYTPYAVSVSKEGVVQEETLEDSWKGADQWSELSLLARMVVGGHIQLFDFHAGLDIALGSATAVGYKNNQTTGEECDQLLDHIRSIKTKLHRSPGHIYWRVNPSVNASTILDRLEDAGLLVIEKALSEFDILYALWLEAEDEPQNLNSALSGVLSPAELGSMQFYECTDASRYG